ncbi:phospholipase A and acyltransferase 5 [Echinops telfairi]|uniref:Phospholipase A and acyltransferase 5 n=1 Tax=Echinops telfairi TaxID=9371 RepID=A0AC55DN10_ECHTE|nr:phospholipase A and acyltransferase 5 [Echinops telfairi]
MGQEDMFCDDPTPGDLIEIFHIGYKDWAIYVGDGEFPSFGSSKMFTFLSRNVVVAKDPLEEVTWGCLYRVNNFLDHQYRPQPVDKILSSAKKMIGDQKTHQVLSKNSENFVTDLRYGLPRCKLSCQDPQPGDLIAISRVAYKHWAIYMGNGNVVHLNKSEFEAGSITSVFSNRAIVKYSHLEDVLHGCSWKVNNKLDETYLPLPVDKIIQRAKTMINKIVQYSLIEGNCEHFVNDLRYGVSRSQQVEHALMEGAKAAGAVLSAVVDSIRPKPVTA